MGCFTEEITLSNNQDKVRVEAGTRKEVRSVTVQAIPDTGAWTLVINEDVRQKLGLNIEKRVKSTIADGTVGLYGLTEPVTVSWKDRDTTIRSLVVPKAKTVLLGAIPLEDMDLYVDVVNKRLAGVNGDEPVFMVYSLGLLSGS